MTQANNSTRATAEEGARSTIERIAAFAVAARAEQLKRNARQLWGRPTLSIPMRKTIRGIRTPLR